MRQGSRDFRCIQYDEPAFSFHPTEDTSLERTQEINRFLASVEKRAYRMVHIATGNREDALDILQDAMCKLVEKYADRDATTWHPLFYTILQSRIRDWYRREKIRNRFRVWFGVHSADHEASVDYVDKATPDPAVQLQRMQQLQEVEKVIRSLPIRQQQAFMLRVFESCDVRQTAEIMGCSEGSVKTHHARAMATMRDKLGENT